MKKLFTLILILATADLQAADRIKSMSHAEQCIYRARIAAAGAYMREAKKASTCQDINILWHGDETEYELDYVKKWTCEGFKSGKDPIAAGDTIFHSCTAESEI